MEGKEQRHGQMLSKREAKKFKIRLLNSGNKACNQSLKREVVLGPAHLLTS